MTQYNFRTWLEPNLFSGHFDKAGTVLASRFAHCSCMRMMRGAKTDYTTSLTSVTNPNSWMTYRAYSTGFWHNFFRDFSFLSIFCVPGKTSVIRVFPQVGNLNMNYQGIPPGGEFEYEFLSKFKCLLYAQSPLLIPLLPQLRVYMHMYVT